MLQTLRIRNLVIVEDVTLEPGPGLNVLTGETGAGKSILVDALALLSGGRADRGAVREGERRAVIEALFDVAGREDVAAWMDERGLGSPEDGQVLIHREVAASTAGRVLINGSPATLPLLRELAEMLLELHGQHEQQEWMRPERHLELVDRFAGHPELLSRVADGHRALESARMKVASLVERSERRDRRIQELETSVREIEGLAPRPGELEQIEIDRRVLQSAGKMAELFEAAVALSIEGEPSARDLAAAAAARVEELAEIDPSLEEIARRLRAAAIEVADAGAALRDARERQDFDLGRLEGLEARRAALERSCLRHATDESGLLEIARRAREELAMLGRIDAELRAARVEEDRAAEAYVSAAVALGRARAKAAREISGAVGGQLAELALASSRLEVELVPARGEAVTAAGHSVALSPRGGERAELRFTANPGEPPRPLQLAASGGELSRVMLALHVVAGDARDRRAVVFDEVDAGVSGAVADAVGARLARLAHDRQVLCVTHLPQVAAYADRHFSVAKRVQGARTTTVVSPLAGADQVEELARLLGGREVTATSREHAAALLEAARRPVAGARSRARRGA